MRQVVSLSLPATEVKQSKILAKNRGFGSLSAYIQYLLSAERDIMSEAELLKRVRKADKEYKAGKAIRARSIADLL